jgi:hypothetical protein
MTIGVSAPRWAPDPVGRFAQRYWDGARWTEHVAGPAGGAPETDLLLRDESVIPPIVDAESEPPAAARNGADERPLDATPPASSEPAASPHGATTEVGSNPPVWAPDPSGRHARRYWDGSHWTDFVAPAGGGAPERDALQPGVALLPPAALRSGGSTLVPGADHRTDATELESGAPLEPATSGTSAISSALGVIVGVAATPATTSEPTTSAPQWAADPSGRHPQRDWDGTA